MIYHERSLETADGSKGSDPVWDINLGPSGTCVTSLPSWRFDTSEAPFGPLSGCMAAVVYGESSVLQWTKGNAWIDACIWGHSTPQMERGIAEKDRFCRWTHIVTGSKINVWLANPYSFTSNISQYTPSGYIYRPKGNAWSTIPIMMKWLTLMMTGWIHRKIWGKRDEWREQDWTLPIKGCSNSQSILVEHRGVEHDA